jgi:hypothetical protein
VGIKRGGQTLEQLSPENAASSVIGSPLATPSTAQEAEHSHQGEERPGLD